MKLSEAEAAPAAVGVKTTDTVQEVLAATVPSHVLVSAKEEEAAPVMVRADKVNGPVPVFLSVTVCAADDEPTLVEAKLRLVGESVTAGVPVPVPLRVTLCGDAGPLS